jgi:hypothetical protein
LVSPIHDGKYLGVQYNGLIPVLIEAIKELNEKCNSFDTDSTIEIRQLMEEKKDNSNERGFFVCF